MRKSQIKQEERPSTGWNEVIRDAEEEIALYEQRITRLRRVIRGAEIQAEAGVPFPETFDVETVE